MTRSPIATRALAALLSLAVPVLACADTVLCTDGRRLAGEVTRTADGVTVKTKFGTISLKTWEIKEIVKDAAPATPPVKPDATAPGAITPGAPATDPPAGAAPPRPTAASAKSIDALIKSGSDALLAGDYAAARDAFFDAWSLEPRNVRALHGLGLSFLYLGQLPRAVHYMQRAHDASGNKPGRALVHNLAMAHLGMNQPMRAVKLVRDYLEQHKKEPDEAMLNALGSGLFLTDHASRRNPLWGTSADFYVEYQRTVEKTRPGMKRWGVEWLPAREADDRKNAMRKKDEEANKVGAELDQQELKVLDAKRGVRRAQVGIEKGFSTPAGLQAAKVKVERELAEYNRVAKKYDEAMDQVVRPLFPRVLSPVALDDNNPASGADNVRVTMSDPAFKEALAKAARAPDPGKRSVAEPMDDPKPATPTPPAPVDPPTPTPVVAIRPEPGRSIRVPRYAAAFAVAPDLVVTALAPVDGAAEIELQAADGTAHKARLLRKDDRAGLALLRLVNADRKLAFFALGDAFAGGDLRCAAFPTVDLFNPAPALLAGRADAAADGWTIKLDRNPRLPGAPLISGAKVVGVVLATRDAPADRLPAVGPDALRALVGADAGKGPATADAGTALLQLTATSEVGGK